MKLPSTRSVAAFASVALLATLIAHAARPDAEASATDRMSADLLPNAAAHRLAPRAASTRVAATSLTVEDVGDTDSFGRAVVWLGVTQGDIDLSPTCPVAGGDPTANCVTLNAAPALTSFSLNDIAHVTLPAKAANSLLCYWFSPFLTLGYDNPTAVADVGLLTYSPTLTVESEVIADPAMIDPMTGAPFNGSLTTAMTSSERFEVPLAPGQQLNERSRDSAVCIAGFLSKRALVDNYGLTSAQADQFFKKPMTVRLNVNGSVRLVEDGHLTFGLRIVGD
jgi:hypothetical protein